MIIELIYHLVLLPVIKIYLLRINYSLRFTHIISTSFSRTMQMVFQFPPFFFYQKLLHKHHENKMFFFILLYTYMYILHIIGDKLPHENRYSFYFRNITSWHHFFSHSIDLNPDFPLKGKFQRSC